MTPAELLERAERDFEVLDSHRGKWAMRNPHDPTGVPRIVWEADEWTATWRDRIPKEWRLPDD